MIRVAFVTEGDPDRMSGGFLYHRRVADLAHEHDAAVHFVSVPQRRFPLALVDGPAVMRAAAADADVVVVDSLASNTLGPWIARARSGHVPIVGSIHQNVGGIDQGRVRRTVQARFDRMAWAGSARLIVASEHLAAQLAAAGLSRDDMTVVPPGRDVPTGSTERSAVADLRDGRRAALICVGNWLARKGIVDVIDAVAALPERSATLHLVGDEAVDARYRRRVLERLARPDVGDRVVRHGIVAPSAMGQLYEAADVFVLGSTDEPYGTVYGEAMVAGLPVVGWAAGNLPTLVDDRVEGRIVPAGDVVALTAALGELCDDEALRARLAEAARSRADKLPTWSETAGRFFAVCRAVTD